LTEYKKPDVIVVQDITDKPEIPDFDWNNFDASEFIQAFAKKRTPLDRDNELYNLLLAAAATAAEGEDAVGKSAYEIWLDAGNVGTVDEFLESLIGPPGSNGDSAYDIWLGLGNVGTKQDFINAITGTDGKSAYELWLDQGYTGTEQEFIDYLRDSSSFAVDFANVDTFLVEHNLGRYPAVTVVDANKNQCLTAVTHLSENSLRIKMNGLKTGTVYCN